MSIILVTEMKNVSIFLAGLIIFCGSAAHAEALFEDGFESRDFSPKPMANGGNFSWDPASVSISDTISRSGSVSAQLVFGPNATGEDSWRELAFRLDSPLSEIWVEYWIYYPANYVHRSQSGPSNNKFFQLNYNGAPKQMLTVESDAQGNGNSAMRRFLSTAQTPSGSANWPVNDSSTRDFIGAGENFAIELGQWTKVLIHYRAGSDGIRNDGRAEVWINDEMIHGLDWPFWEPGNQGMINGGYVLGWSNSGFSQATRIYVDDFKVYNTLPESLDGPAKPKPPSDLTIGKL